MAADVPPTVLVDVRGGRRDYRWHWLRCVRRAGSQGILHRPLVARRCE
jgi:hypothetical protein